MRFLFLLYIFALINLAFIFVYAIGHNVVINIEDRPKLRAVYSIFMTTCLAIYLFSIAVICVLAVLSGHYSSLFLAVFFFAPFIIGKYVTFKTFNMYSNLQLFTLVLSLVYTIYLI